MAPATMTTAETAQVLRRCRHVVVATRGRDGFPAATVASLAYDDVIELRLASDLVAGHLLSDAGLCVVADEWPTYAGIKGVIGHGSATATALVDGDAQNSVQHLRLELDRITTFDFGKTPTI
jgi:hypothetical protein